MGASAKNGCGKLSQNDFTSRQVCHKFKKERSLSGDRLSADDLDGSFGTFAPVNLDNRPLGAHTNGKQMLTRTSLSDLFQRPLGPCAPPTSKPKGGGTSLFARSERSAHLSLGRVRGHMRPRHPPMEPTGGFEPPCCHRDRVAAFP